MKGKAAVKSQYAGKASVKVQNADEGCRTGTLCRKCRRKGTQCRTKAAVKVQQYAIKATAEVYRCTYQVTYSVTWNKYQFVIDRSCVCQSTERTSFFVVVFFFVSFSMLFVFASTIARSKLCCVLFGFNTGVICMSYILRVSCK